MIRKLLCTCAVALLLFSSCTTVRRTAGVAEVQAVVQQYPTVADLEVLPRAEATKTWKFKICHFRICLCLFGVKAILILVYTA